MSLASGLNILHGLTKMQVLCVTRMMHRVGMSELKWMMKNWPCLERVAGLFDP